MEKIGIYNLRGCIGFSTTKDSFISKAIRWFRSSHVSHTFIILDRYTVLEAGFFKVRMNPLKKYFKKSEYVEIYKPKEVDSSTIERAIGKIMDLRGRRYGRLQLLGFIWIWLLRKLFIDPKNPFTKGIICSELVYLYMKELGCKGIEDYTKDEVAPDDLLVICRDYGEFRRVYLSKVE